MLFKSLLKTLVTTNTMKTSKPTNFKCMYLVDDYFYKKSIRGPTSVMSTNKPSLPAEHPPADSDVGPSPGSKRVAPLIVAAAQKLRKKYKKTVHHHKHVSSAAKNSCPTCSASSSADKSLTGKATAPAPPPGSPIPPIHLARGPGTSWHKSPNPSSAKSAASTTNRPPRPVSPSVAEFSPYQQRLLARRAAAISSSSPASTPLPIPVKKTLKRVVTPKTTIAKPAAGTKRKASKTTLTTTAPPRKSKRSSAIAAGPAAYRKYLDNDEDGSE